MKTLSNASYFDYSLTPKNARRRGYNYIDDVIYDVANPSETIIDLLIFCRDYGCKFGKPSQEDGKCKFFGLYMPKN